MSDDVKSVYDLPLHTMCDHIVDAFMAHLGRPVAIVCAVQDSATGQVVSTGNMDADGFGKFVTWLAVQHSLQGGAVFVQEEPGETMQ